MQGQRPLAQFALTTQIAVLLANLVLTLQDISTKPGEGD